MVTFNGTDRFIEVTDAGIVSLDVEQDIYSAWKDWSQLSDNSKYAPALRSFGGDGTIEGQKAPKYFFLQNYWRVRINNGNVVNISLNLYTDDFTTPYVIVAGSGVSDRNSDAVSVNSALIEYAAFDDRVTVDINGQAGNTGLIGSKQQPVNNLADALIIADTRGFERIHIHDDWTFPAGTFIPGLTIEGDGLNSTFTFDTGAILLNCIVENVKCVGDITGIIGFKDCHLKDIGSTNPTPSSQNILIEGSFLEGTLFLPSGYSGTLTMLNCYSSEEVAPPIFDIGSSTANVFLTKYTGGFSVINGTANNRVIVDLIAGRVVIESSVTDGTYTIRGIGSFVNNSTIVPNTNGLVDARDIKNVKVAVETLRPHHTGYGNTFYWDPVNGNDLNDGKSEETATFTFAAALALVEDGHHDVIVAVSGNPAGQTVTTEAIQITKRYTFLRGPGIDFKISPVLTDGTPTIQISASGVEVSGMFVETALTGTQDAIQVDAGVDFALIEDMWIKKATGHGIHFMGSSLYHRVTNTFLDEVVQDGIRFETDIRHTLIEATEVANSALNGVTYIGTSRNNIIGNGTIIHGSGTYGVHFQSGTSKNAIAGNAFVFRSGTADVLDNGSLNTYQVSTGLTDWTPAERVQILGDLTENKTWAKKASDNAEQANLKL